MLDLILEKVYQLRLLAVDITNCEYYGEDDAVLGNLVPADIINALYVLTESLRNEIADIVKELETLRAERKAMMEQEPVAEVSRIYDPKILADVVAVFMPVGAKLYAQPIPVQTEIAAPGEWSYGEDNDGWYVERNENQVCYCASEENARYIAAKLNEHREPDYKAPDDIPNEWRVTRFGQVKAGDVLSLVCGDQHICTTAKEILNAGTNREEVIYNRKKNHYFITSMVLDGTSTHKHVFIVPNPAIAHREGKGEV